MIFLGIILLTGVHVSTKGGGAMGGIGFDGGQFSKKIKNQAAPPLWETLPLDFCLHQHFFTANLQVFLYQEIQI